LEALEFGAQGYLTKPVDREKLLHAVRTQIAQLESTVKAGPEEDEEDLSHGNEQLKQVTSVLIGWPRLPI